MKAMILAAGLGARLGKITQNTPKALVEVKGKAILEHVINNLLAVGVNSFVLNLHYLPEQIKKFIKEKDFPADFQFSYEEELLDTGGAIKRAQSLLSGDEFILHNCDIYTDANIQSLLNAHQDSSVATCAISECKSDRYLLFEPDLRFAGWESNQQSLSKFMGIRQRLIPYDYNCINVISSKFFDYVKDLPDRFSLFDVYLKAIEANQIIMGHKIDYSYWIDIGSEEKLAEANRLNGM